MKILLIYPNVDYRFDSLVRYSFLVSAIKKTGNLFSKYPIVTPSGGYIVPPVGLLIAAASIPPGVEIELIDERVEKIDYNSDADLVGISVITSAANRAYEISRRFRQKGIPVILGGVHTSLFPKEAETHADSIVLGEVEGLWEKIIEDLKSKTLKKRYENQELHSLKNLPIPRFDLLKSNRYLVTNIIETSRGCPHKCSFCATSKFFGNKYRFRPIEDIVNEIKERKLENQHVIFISDNIFGKKSFAEALFKALIPLNITWMGGVTISIGNDPELLKLASKSGCKSMLIGFESIKASNLDKINKNQNSDPANYPRLIKAIHRENIGITGNLILGLDDDHPSIFKEIIDFINTNKIECPQISILIPYPGTPIHETLKNENRILNFNYDNYTNSADNVVFEPKNMSVSDLKDGYWEIYKGVYSVWPVIKRLFSTRNFVPFYLPYNLLLGLKRYKIKPKREKELISREKK